MESPEIDHAVGAIACFLFQLSDRGDVCRLAFLLVADKAGRQLQAIAVQRHAKLFDEQDMPVLSFAEGALVHCEDHGGADTPRARDELPFALALGGDELALPDRLYGIGRVLSSSKGHSSIRRSGSSFVSSLLLGRHSARTAPTFSTAEAMPSPGRPAFTPSTSVAIASPPPPGPTSPPPRQSSGVGKRGAV